LPQAAKATSLEAKWRLLQLTLLHAAQQQQQQFQLQLQQLLDGVLLQHAQQKLAKVSNGNGGVEDMRDFCGQQIILMRDSVCMHMLLDGTQLACCLHFRTPSTYIQHFFIGFCDRPRISR
jgi:hypothetical protein